MLGLLPVVALAVVASHANDPVWAHLVQYVLPGAAIQTGSVLVGVTLVLIPIGTGTAWLVTVYSFPGRDLLAWALLLPLTVPSYIVAYSYLDLLHPVGPIQTGLRTIFGIAQPSDFALPDIRSTTGCILLLGVVLYPYVYLTTRASLATQGADALWAARGFGATGLRLFFRIGLPLARPAVAVGVSLALMEALNDIGASEFLGVRTLTVSIYVTWLTRGSLEGAARIALALLAFVVLLLALEHWGRRHATTTAGQIPLEPLVLSGRCAWAATLACAMPVLLGFLLPAGHLAFQAWRRVSRSGLPPQLWEWMGNSAFLAAQAALVAAALGFILAFVTRLSGGGMLLRLGTVGYALPGGVAAVGLTIALGWVDDVRDLIAEAWSGQGTAWPLLGSSSALIMAYVVRFLAIPATSLDAAYARIDADFDHAARMLGCQPSRMLWCVHLPMLVWPLTTGMILVFVDAMKELPATLLLRPVNVETLATVLYGEAIRGTYEDGAIAALALVVVAMAPALLLARLDGRTRHRPSIPSLLRAARPAG